MVQAIVLEVYDGTNGYVVVGEGSTTATHKLCWDLLPGQPFMGTNARHPNHTPMLWVPDDKVADVVGRLVKVYGCYVTFKGQKQRRTYDE